MAPLLSISHNKRQENCWTVRDFSVDVRSFKNIIYIISGSWRAGKRTGITSPAVSRSHYTYPGPPWVVQAAEAAVAAAAARVEEAEARVRWVSRVFIVFKFFLFFYPRCVMVF
jgi:hypothetical protein